MHPILARKAWHQEQAWLFRSHLQADKKGKWIENVPGIWNKVDQMGHFLQQSSTSQRLHKGSQQHHLLGSFFKHMILWVIFHLQTTGSYNFNRNSNNLPIAKLLLLWFYLFFFLNFFFHYEFLMQKVIKEIHFSSYFQWVQPKAVKTHCFQGIVRGNIMNGILGSAAFFIVDFLSTMKHRQGWWNVIIVAIATNKCFKGCFLQLPSSSQSRLTNVYSVLNLSIDIFLLWHQCPC